MLMKKHIKKYVIIHGDDIMDRRDKSVIGGRGLIEEVLGYETEEIMKDIEKDVNKDTDEILTDMEKRLVEEG